MTQVTCRLTAKTRDQHRNPNEYELPLPFYCSSLFSYVLFVICILLVFEMYFVLCISITFFCNLYLKYSFGQIGFTHTSLTLFIRQEEIKFLYELWDKLLLISKAVAHFGQKWRELSWLLFWNSILLHLFVFSLFFLTTFVFDNWKLKEICISLFSKKLYFVFRHFKVIEKNIWSTNT